MSREIDERIVEMRFDNKQFEENTKQTMGTLRKLKEALNFSGATRGFDDIQKVSSKVDMSGLGNAVEKVKLKFSALEVAAITVLSNIVNRAFDAGERLVKSLSVDQVTAGFQEYELKMGSIQTIIASTGESLGVVNKYLDELNNYADKTIYSFSDMTQNIGKFTNAGVKLEDAVKAIQGISNEAAVSGANANEASRAMYNFAQALSAGYVKLIDWKSIENANMATVEFKQGLLDTALALGTVVKVGDKYQSTTTDLNNKVSELFDSTSMFNDSLAHQWLSTEVLVQTLNNYSNDVRTMTDAEKEAYEEKLRSIGYTEEQIKSIEELGIKAFDSAQDVKTLSQLLDTMRESVGSGWAQTFELIIGDFEEAKDLWTNVNNTLGTIIQESSDSRNELLRQWKEAGGRTALLDAISNSFNAILSVAKEIKKAFRNIFPKMTADRLVTITKNFRDFTAKLQLSEETLGKLGRTFSGLFSIIDIIGQAIKAFFKLISPGASKVKDLSGGILDITASIGDWIVNLDKAIKENGWFIKAVEKIQKVIGNTLGKIDDFVRKTGEMVKSLLHIEDINIDDVISNISNAFKNLSFEVDDISFETVINAFSTLKNKVKELLNVPMSNEGFSTFVKNLKDFGKELKEAFTLDNLLDRIERIMDVFGKFFNWIKENLGPAFKDFNIGSVVAAGGGFGLIYSLIKIAKSFDKVAGSVKAIPNLLKGVREIIESYQKKLKAEALLKIAGAIAILAGSLVLLSFADTERLVEASIALSLVGGVLFIGVSKLLDAVNKGKELNQSLKIFAEGFKSTMKKFGRAIEIKAIGSTIKDFAKSIAIIAVSIIALGIMWKKDSGAFNAAFNALHDIGIVLGAMAALIVIGSKLGNPKAMLSIGTSVLMMSTSLGLIVGSIYKLFKMELPSDYGVKLEILGGIIGGLAALSVLLAATAKISGGNQLPKMTGAIISLSLLLAITVSSLKALFKMELPSDYGVKLEILGGIFAALAVLVLAMGAAAKISKGTGFKAASTIIAMAAFLAVVVASLFVLTVMPADKLLKGALAIGGILVALGVALAGAGKASKKGTSKSVLAMAITIGAITVALAVLATVPWDKLVKGAVALGSILLILTADFKALSKVKSKNALPAALAMIATVLSIAYSLTALSNQPWEGLLAAAAAMSATMLAYAKAFEMILKPNWSKNSLSKIGLFGLMILETIPIALELGVLANQPWEGLLAAATSLSLTMIALAGCFAIVSKIKINKEALVNVIAGSASLVLIAASVALLANYDGEQLLNSCLALSAMLAVIIGVMAACAALSSVASAAMAGILELGIVIVELGAILTAIGALAQIPGLKWLIDEGGVLLEGIGTAIGKFVGGIVGGVLSGISSQLPQIGSDLSAFMTNLIPFITLSKNIDAKSVASVGFLASIILALTVSEVVNGIASLFGLSLVDLGTELSNFMISLLPFMSLSKGLNEETMRACTYLAGMIAALTVSEVVNGIARIFGMDRSLSEFGEELVAFGPSIKEFAEVVKDVKPEAVKGAAAAAEIMANLADKLPEQDGLIQKIMGKKSLAEFGAHLVAFAPDIVKFAEVVKDVKPEAVNGVASITDIMSTLANNLPSTETLWNKIFGGGQVTLSEFGTELISFGENMVTFSGSLSDFNLTDVNAAIEGFRNMVDLATYVSGISADDLLKFSKQLSKIGSDSVDNFVKAFKDSSPTAIAVIKELGKNSVKALSDGVESKRPLLLTMVTLLCSSMIGKFRIVLDRNTFKVFGENLVSWFSQGMESKKSFAILEATVISSAVVQAFRNNLTSSAARDIGANFALGLKGGIESKINEIANAAIAAAKKAIEAAKKALDEHSPSKKAAQLGEYFSLGIAMGIDKKIKSIALPARKAMNAAIDPVRQAADIINKIINSGDFDSDPVIKPVVDISEVKRGAKEISALMNQTYDISETRNKAKSVASSFDKLQKTKSKSSEEAEKDSKMAEGNKYEFIQNNYSPKALSRSEIYRNTNNQFSAFRKAVNRT